MQIGHQTPVSIDPDLSRRTLPHVYISARLVECPERLLNCNAKPTNTQNSPQPLVTKLLHARPERILVSAELLQLSELVRLRSGVATFLVLLLLGIAAEEAEEAIVCDGAEELDGCEHVRAIKHDDEGDVDQGIAKVASLYQRKHMNGLRSHILGVPDKTPDALPENAFASFSLVLVELVVCKSLKRQARREETNSRHLDVRVVAHHHSTFVSERGSERKTDQHLEEGLWNEDLEEGRVPETFFLFDFGISRIVLTTLYRTTGDPVEQSAAPKGHTSQHDPFVP